MRDILIHEYFGVDFDLTWTITKTEIPKLKQVIRKILSAVKKQGKSK